jgi:hypothetical protein
VIEATAPQQEHQVRRSNHGRSRWKIVVLIFLVIFAGLASRKFPHLLPEALGKYPGDSLWALMVFLLWAFVKPHISTVRLSVLALATTFAIEFSQLYQAAWINEVRRTTLGQLILGAAFSWIDLCAYVIGVAAGVALDRWRWPISTATAREPRQG